MARAQPQPVPDHPAQQRRAQRCRDARTCRRVSMRRAVLRVEPLRRPPPRPANEPVARSAEAELPVRALKNFEDVIALAAEKRDSSINSGARARRVSLFVSRTATKRSRSKRARVRRWSANCRSNSTTGLAGAGWWRSPLNRARRRCAPRPRPQSGTQGRRPCRSAGAGGAGVISPWPVPSTSARRPWRLRPCRRVDVSVRIRKRFRRRREALRIDTGPGDARFSRPDETGSRTEIQYERPRRPARPHGGRRARPAAGF